jgi:hypothetical protein
MVFLIANIGIMGKVEKNMDSLDASLIKPRRKTLCFSSMDIRRVPCLERVE